MIIQRKITFLLPAPVGLHLYFIICLRIIYYELVKMVPKVTALSSENKQLLELATLEVFKFWGKFSMCTRHWGINSWVSSSFYSNKSWNSLIICYGKRSHQGEPTCLNCALFSIEAFTKPFAILLSVLLKRGILYFHQFLQYFIPISTGN